MDLQRSTLQNLSCNLHNTVFKLLSFNFGYLIPLMTTFNLIIETFDRIVVTDI